MARSLPASRAEDGLRARPKEDEALREEMVNRLKRKVGELTMDLDILREAARLRPTTPGRPTSDGDMARLSMRKVCKVLKFPRARLRARAVIAKVPTRCDETTGRAHSAFDRAATRRPRLQGRSQFRPQFIVCRQPYFNGSSGRSSPTTTPNERRFNE